MHKTNILYFLLFLLINSKCNIRELEMNNEENERLQVILF